MYAYSKLRRENANFKINTKVDSEGNPVYIADPSTGSDEPITGLLQILQKGLDCYDFLGMCVESEQTIGPDIRFKGFIIVSRAMLHHAGSRLGVDVVLPIDAIAIDEELFYIPSNGYLVTSAFDLSSLVPEEEEGGETGGRVIDLTKLQYDSSTKTWSGYETGLGANDFEGAKIIGDGDPIGVRLVSTASREDGFTIKLQTDTVPPLWYYNPTTGQFTLNRPSSQESE